MTSMKLEIGGVIALALGIWALTYSWWFVMEIIEGLVALGLIAGGLLAIAISLRKRFKARSEA